MLSILIETMTAREPCEPGDRRRVAVAAARGVVACHRGCEYERLHAVFAYGFERITTHVRLVGAGADGLGEDVSVFREDGTTLHETKPSLRLEGEWTLAGFCEHLATRELWPQPPDWDAALRLRTWAFGRRRLISRCARPAARCTTCSGCSRSRCASSPRLASVRSLRSPAARRWLRVGGSV